MFAGNLIVNTTNTGWKKSSEVWALLSQEFGLVLPTFHVEPLSRYRALIQEWNPIAKLLSVSDAKSEIDAHVADSLTLLPYCYPNSLKKLLDIGSGGGFPGIPLAIAAPELLITLLDRSERKTAFLKRVALQLRLGNLSIQTGSFPEALGGQRYDFATARAVEKPATLKKDILDMVRSGATFLCQSEGALPGSPEVETEPVDDVFSKQGYRRSRLWVVKSRS